MFATPLFLIAAAVGAAVPLVLHLMQKRNAARVPFPTLRFLQEAIQQSSRRVRMENILLWLLRTLIMICLGLAFAMPMLRTRNFAWLGDTPRDVAIIVDASYSMDYNLGRQTVWERAIDVASTLIQGLGENDRFCIYVAREKPDPIIAEPTADTEDGLARLKALPCGFSSSSLAPTLIAANDALKAESRRREREIYILTDGQALPWSSFVSGNAEADDDDGRSSTEAWDPDSIDERTIVFVALLGADAPENVAPTDVDLNPPLLLQGTAPNITTRLMGVGGATETVVTLHMGGKEIGRRTAQVGAGAERNPSFSIPSLPLGTHAVRIETPDDNLPIDNAFHFLVRVREELPTLCVGSKEDTFFVRAALHAAPNGTADSEARWVTPDALAEEELHAYAAVFLCNAIPLPGQSLTVLEQYVKAGGLLAIFPGPQGAISDYQAWQNLPATPTGTTDVRPSSRKQMLTWAQPQHPVVRGLLDSLSLPVVTLKRHLAWDKLREETETLISLGDGTPFLLERAYGRGRVLMFCTAADRAWSDFPLSPFYLPVIRQIIEYGAGIGAFAPFVWSCDALPLGTHLPEATSNSRIMGPEGNAAPIRSAIVAGHTVLHVENLAQPGIYDLIQPGQTATPGLAVNIDRRESDLTPLTPSDLPELLDIKHLQIAADKDALLAMVDELRIGRTFGEHLLWLALLLALAEFVYANMLIKDRPKLVDQLKIRPSGKVSGHVPHAAGGAMKGGAS